MWLFSQLQKPIFSDLRKDELPDECLVDIQEDSRDYYRNPLAWTSNSEENFGFSDCTGNAEDAPEGKCFEIVYF